MKFRVAAAIFSLLSLVGCASYQGKVDEARRSLVGDPAAAVAKLEPLAKEEGRDQLVYMLDYATALQVAGRFEESVKAFLTAERLADLKDYHSVTKVATSLALSEEMVQYKGEDFEKVLINNMNALNFLELGRLDDALVEVRRVNEKLYALKYDGKKDFNQSPLAFYLGAILWEADRKYDDAYIAYKNAYDVAPAYRPLREDLIRSAIRAQRPEEVEKWKKSFPEVVVKNEWKDKTMGEVVVLYLQGWGPRKQPRPEAPRFPQLVSVTYAHTPATIAVYPGEFDAAQTKMTTLATTEKLYSVDEVAIKALEGDYARLVASRVAGIATKAVLADQLRQKDELLGTIAWLALNISDRADLRQWSTLPSSFQVARIPLKAGKYNLRLQSGGVAISASGSRSRTVDVKAMSKSFIVWREF